MEDRYLFKAKRLDNGEWVEGALFNGESHCIIGQEIKFSPYTEHECKIVGNEVDRDTICQCTGLKDKNGKLIWENDITLRTSVTGTHKGKIIYSSDGSFCQKDFETTFENLLIHSESYFEVIGNIFDNPELLESEG